jgi:hypothetical protein
VTNKPRVRTPFLRWSACRKPMPGEHGVRGLPKLPVGEGRLWLLPPPMIVSINLHYLEYSSWTCGLLGHGVLRCSCAV